MQEGLTVDQAIANLHHPDTSLRYYAAWWLGKFRVKAAVPALVECLQDEDDRTELGGYPLRRNAARALGKLGDIRAVPELLICLDCPDYYVREAAAEALGLLGDPRSIPRLQAFLDTGVGAAMPVSGRPHLNQPYEAIIEALGNLGATEAEADIKPFLEHPVPRLRYAAARTMYQLTQDPQYGQILIDSLGGEDVQLRRSALNDLGAIGYLPAAQSIVQAAAESSFKLIALKGLLEHQLRLNPDPHAPDAQYLMELMDGLL